MQSDGIFTFLVFKLLKIQLKQLQLTFKQYFYPKRLKNLIRTLRCELLDSQDHIELIMLAINRPLWGIVMLSIVKSCI